MLRVLLPRNEGALDRMLRLVVGVGVLALAFVGPQSPWGYVGLIPILTALVGSCPLYTVFGLKTCAAPVK